MPTGPWPQAPRRTTARLRGGRAGIQQGQGQKLRGHTLGQVPCRSVQLFLACTMYWPRALLPGEVVILHGGRRRIPLDPRYERWLTMPMLSCFLPFSGAGNNLPAQRMRCARFWVPWRLRLPKQVPAIVRNGAAPAQTLRCGVYTKGVMCPLYTAGQRVWDGEGGGRTSSNAARQLVRVQGLRPVITQCNPYKYCIGVYG